MDKIISKVNQFLSGLSGWLMIGMMLLLVGDVVSRAAGFAINGLAELSVFVMIIVIYFGLARCEEHGEHVNLELFTNMLPNNIKTVMFYLAQILSVVTVALIVYSVLQNALDSYQSHESLEGTLELPIWPIKAMMVIGLIFFLFQSISQFLGSLTRKNIKNKTQDISATDQELSH